MTLFFLLPQRRCLAKVTVLADTTVCTTRKLLLANTIDAAKMSVHLALPLVLGG